MEVNGREVKFLRTIGATCEIAELCADGDLKNIGNLFTGKIHDRYVNWVKIILALNKGYEDSEVFRTKGKHEPNPLTEEEVMALPQNIFDQLVNLASIAYTGEVPTVEVEPDKSGKKNETSETSD